MKPLESNERQTLSKIISKQIKQYIQDEQLKPGDKLPPERELMKSLGVSRSSLREGLKYLVMSGILSIRHGGGSYVNAFNLAPLMEELEYHWNKDRRDPAEWVALRYLLESAVVDMALQCTPEDWQRMERHLEEDFPEIELHFHMSFIRLAGNELIVQIASIVSDLFQAIVIPLLSRIDHTKIADQRRALLSAIKNKDLPGMKASIEATKNLFETQLA